MKNSKFEELIKQIVKIYFIALRSINENTISSGEIDYYSPFYKYYADVEEAFAMLDKEKKKIITKEYFYDGYRGWWNGIYTSKDFNKKRKIAVKEFVEAFYEIH